MMCVCLSVWACVVESVFLVCTYKKFLTLHFRLKLESILMDPV